MTKEDLTELYKNQLLLGTVYGKNLLYKDDTLLVYSEKYDRWGIKKYTGSAEHVVFPEGVDFIKAGAFQYSNIKSIYAPGVIRVESLAFNNCVNLKSVSFPKCQTLGHSAFNFCRELEIAYIPKVKVIPYYAFYFCNKLKKLNLSSATKIDKRAFFGTALDPEAYEHVRRMTPVQGKVIVNQFKLILHKIGNKKEYPILTDSIKDRDRFNYISRATGVKFV